MPTLGAYDLARVLTAQRAAAGRKAIYSFGGADGTWSDDLGGTAMVAQGAATYTAATGIAHFGGVAADFFSTTPTIPTWGGLGFSGSGASGGPGASGWSVNGIRICCLVKIAVGDLVGRTLIHWKNTGDETRWMVRFNAAGQLEFWNQYHGDVTSFYQQTPPGDRFFTIPVDFRAWVSPSGAIKNLADGDWHLFDFGRGASTPQPESKRVMIDGEMAYQAVTGNGVNGFNGPDTPVAVGLALATTRTADPVFDAATTNFKGDMAQLMICNSDGSASGMTSLYQYAVNANSGLASITRSFGRYARYLRGPR